MPRGGKRPGAGKPKGYKHRGTLDKIAAREYLRSRVIEHMDALIAAQLDNAKGLSHFYLRGEGGKFERITDPEAIERALNDQEAAEGSRFYIHTKDPSIQAFADLMNRALDKPAEHVEVTGADGGALEVKWLK